MRILADTSAWSMLLRRDPAGRGPGPAAGALREFLEEGVPVFLTGVIYQELLTGFRSEPRRSELIQRLEPFEMLQPRRDTHEQAARLADRCLRRGISASAIDVLIAQLAIERDCTLLTADSDFHSIARCARLKILPAAT